MYFIDADFQNFHLEVMWTQKNIMIHPEEETH